MIRMVVADMDGTIVRPDGSISANTIAAISHLRKRGISFTIATGRPDQLMKEYVNELGLIQPMIMCNGSVIGHPFVRDRVHETVLSPTVVRKIIEHCHEMKINFMAYTKEYIISPPIPRRQYFEERNTQLKERERSVFKDIEDLEEIVSHQIYKILLIIDEKDTYDKAKNFFSNVDDVVVSTSNKSFIDINPVDTNKGNALAILAESLQYDLSEIAAIGDQENDITMLEKAGLSIAMGNASDAVKAIADHTTQTVENDGFATWVFEEFE